MGSGIDALGGRRLRLGIVVDALEVPAWIAKVVRDCAAADFVDPALVIRLARPADAAQRFLLSDALYRWYQGFARRHAKLSNHYLEPVDMSPLVEGCRRLELQHGDLDQGEETLVRDLRLDVILHLASGAMPAGLDACAAFGVWACYHGADGPHADPDAHVWEMCRGEHLVASSIEVLGPDGQPRRVLYRSFAAVHPRSLEKSRNEAFWKTAAFPIRCLRTLHQRGWDALKPLPGHGDSTAIRRVPRRRPGNLQMFSLMWRIALRVLEQRFYHTAAFFVALGPRVPGQKIEDLARVDLRIVEPPPGRFYADPMLVEAGGRDCLFVEDADLRTGFGRISMLPLAADGRPGAPEVVLQRDYHLSYPYVFVSEGVHYMIPETGSRQTIELYRASDFPRGWELVATLMRGLFAADATVIAYQGRFWLFAAVSQCGGSVNDELFLFWADALLGPWQAHPMNPVVSDVRRARPAGPLFRRGEQLIRPAQDCSRTYGGAMVLNLVETLSVSDYRERQIGRIEPDWRPGLQATHTIGASDRFVVTDGKRPWPRWRTWIDDRGSPRGSGKRMGSLRTDG